MLENILEWFPEEEILIADGYNDAIIGIEEGSMRVIYSVSKCIKILEDVDRDWETILIYFLT